MKHPTATLEGVNLDYAVAMALGYPKDGCTVFISQDRRCKLHRKRSEVPCEFDEQVFMPSTAWVQGGPIIEREHIGLAWWPEDCVPSGWRGYIEERHVGGPTPLIAAMRCFVASKLGEEVEIP